MTLLDDFIADLGFAPDDFQLRACRAIEAGLANGDIDPMQWLESTPTSAENAA